VERIASLLPSLTETACALGLRDRLVGRSHECDYPPGVEALPALTAPRRPLEGGSRGVDARVRELVRGGLSLFEVDAEALRALAPTLVLTQDQCALCAASLADVERALGAWTGSAPRVLSVAPWSLREVWASLRAVAEAAGVPERGAALAAALTERVVALGERASGLGHRPRLACLEWLDPPMDAGHWMPELAALAGGRATLGAAGAPSRVLAPGALAAADPDVVLLAPCGYELARTRAELPALLARPELAALRAVREGRVYAADGNAYFNRPGPRLADSLEILAEVLHPEQFDFGHAGRAYERVRC
jgi:iron complex transport system substrate-binding protein